MVILGQPDAESRAHRQSAGGQQRAELPDLRHHHRQVKGLNAFPQADWPTNIPLLYYSYHIMAGWGRMFVAVMAGAAFLLVARRALPRALDAVDPAAVPAVSLHRQHGRLDDGGNGPPALAGLRPDAHQRRLLARTSTPATACSRCWGSWGCTRCWRSSSCS